MERRIRSEEFLHRILARVIVPLSLNDGADPFGVDGQRRLGHRGDLVAELRQKRIRRHAQHARKIAIVRISRWLIEFQPQRAPAVLRGRIIGTACVGRHCDTR